MLPPCVALQIVKGAADASDEEDDFLILSRRNAVLTFKGMMNWSAAGAILLVLAVIIGAFGAHALQGRLDAYSKGIYETGVMYHFFHALGLLVVSFLPRVGALSASRTAWVCGLLLAGVFLFSGSLYALAISGVRMWGAVTPFGGLCFIAAWLLLAYWLMRAA